MKVILGRKKPRKKRSDRRCIRRIRKKYAATKETWHGSNFKEPE